MQYGSRWPGSGQTDLLPSALVLGKSATAGRATKLEAKYHALFTGAQEFAAIRTYTATAMRQG